MAIALVIFLYPKLLLTLLLVEKTAIIYLLPQVDLYIGLI